MKKMISLLILSMSLSTFADPGGSSGVGTGNPASDNCEKLGGKIEVVETPAGQAGYCAIDEWTLFREMYSRGVTKPHTYECPAGPCMPNPAAVNCQDVGGTTRVLETPAGQEGICVVDEWALFRIINVTK